MKIKIADVIYIIEFEVKRQFNKEVIYIACGRKIQYESREYPHDAVDYIRGSGQTQQEAIENMVLDFYSNYDKYYAAKY